MILLEHNPQKSLYLLGAKLMFIWKTSGDTEWRVTEAYDALCQEVQISFSMFALTLDWLFLINLLVLTDEGKLKQCSLKN